MNHEILFKAKRKDNGEWIESLTLLKLNEHLYMFQTAWGEITYDLQYNITTILEGKKPFFVEVIPETVGRYTGLPDKNGMKIFEGDIIVWDYAVTDIDGSTHTTPEIVRWDKNLCGFIVNNDDMTVDEKCRVIGNVHDNPELLEVNENETD